MSDTPASPEPAPEPAGFFARIGLALWRPRWALAIATDRRHAGRSGTDLILVMLIVVIATQLRGLVGAVWLVTDVSASLGLKAAVQLLTRSLTVDLAFLVLGALVLWAGAGARRDLGRAFDLACVAALPLLVVDLVVTAIVRGLDRVVPTPLGWVLAGLSFGWAGALLALGWRSARATATPPPPPRELVRPARRIGLGVAAFALVAIVFHVVWIARHLDTLRPVATGEAAPAFALPRIGPGGKLGDNHALAPDKITVIDFWATWCQPCIRALPKLEQLARDRPDIEVVTINLDDAAAARTLFDQAGYTMFLLADDTTTSERYGVTNIPHTVVVDQRGIVRHVARGRTNDVKDQVDRLAPGGSAQIRK